MEANLTSGVVSVTSTASAYRRLQLEGIESEWVEDVLNGNFCEEVAEIPAVVEEHWNEVIMSNVVEVTRKWIEMNSDREKTLSSICGDPSDAGPPGFWTILCQARVSHKTLLAVIYALLDRTKQSFAERIFAVYSSQLYFSLLQISGTTAYKIFHPMLFQKALDVFNLYPDRESGLRGRKKKHSSSSGPGKPSKKHKLDRAFSVEDEEDDDLWEGEEVRGGRGETPVNQDNEGTLKDEIKLTVKDLLSVLHCYSLRDQEVTRQQIISGLLRLTRLDTTSAGKSSFDPPDSRSIHPHHVSLHYLVWACLDVLCTPRHGLVEKTVTDVFQQLLPYIMMTSCVGGVSVPKSISPSFTSSSQHSVAFVKHIVGRCGSISRLPLKILVQHICFKTPDRAEYRLRMSGVVVCALLRLFDRDQYTGMMEWLLRFSKNAKVSCRMFAMELVNEMFLLPALNEPAPKVGSGEIGYKYLLRIVVARCSDKSPSVRSKALSCLSTAAGSHDNSELLSTLSEALSSPVDADSLFITTPEAEVSYSSDTAMMSMLRRRVSDTKVAVRKSAVQTLAAIVALRKDNVHEKDILTIHERCMDKALSVRKQAMISFTALVLKFQESKYEKMHRLWLDGVLPVIMDIEEGAKEKCLSLMEDVLLSELLDTSMQGTQGMPFVWRLLNILAEGEEQDLRRCVQLMLHHWSRSGKITPHHVKALMSHTERPAYRKAAWMLLAELSSFNQSVIENKFVWDNWRVFSSPDTARENEFIVSSILKVIGCMAKKMGRVALGDIKDQILELLLTFKLPVGVISVAINTLTLSCSAVSPTQDICQATIVKWMLPLLKPCEEYINSALLNESQDQVNNVLTNEEDLLSRLFTLGEVSQLLPGYISSQTCLLLQSLLLSASEAPVNEPHLLSSQSLVIRSFRVPLRLRAHAYLTLGKLCLQNEEMAKDSLVLMSCDLQHTKSPVIKNNIVIIMSDLAVRYSAKVDPYIPIMTMCLKDESLLVRKQTLTVLAHLLQEDYIKSKGGAMFFRFLFTLTDKDLKQLSEFCLLHLLLARNPAIFYQNFVESVFYFNDYRKHRAYNQFKQSDKEKEMFSLAGSTNVQQRRELYAFLLSNMADEHRFQLTAKLCQEVLGGVIDGVIPFDEDSIPLIKDTLSILACQEIKLSSLRWSAQEDAADEDDVLGIAMAKAQTKMISQIVKKNVIENIVPIIIAMKHLLEKERSPLLRDLLKCLKELMQDYRTEIRDILSGDKQLGEEIEFDLRKFEEEQTIAAANRQMTPNTTSRSLMVSALHTNGNSPGVAAASGSRSVVMSSPRLRQSSKHKGSERPLTREANGDAVSSPLMVARTAQNKPPPPPLGTPSGPQVNIPKVPNKTQTPAILTPRVNLMKAAIVASARKTMTITGKQTLCKMNPLEEERERVASTPQGGTAESISFNVSSVLPPSPIPLSSTVKCFMRESTCPEAAANISMMHPNQGPQKPSKWKVK